MKRDKHKPEIRRDSLGRPIYPAVLENLKRHQFKRGQSGNPGGSYKSRPFTDAIAQCCEMKVSDLGFKNTDPAPLAAVKTLFREAIKGSVAAATLLIHAFEGRPAQRMQFENVGGTALQVDSKVALNLQELTKNIRQIYGLKTPESEKSPEPRAKPRLM